MLRPRFLRLLTLAIITSLISGSALASTVNGQVTSITDGHVLGGATVTLGSAVTNADSNGNYSFSNVAAGSYTLAGKITGYLLRSYSITVVSGTTLTQNIQLSVAGKLAGTITDGSGVAIASALVHYSGGVLNQSNTIAANSFGQFNSGWIPVGGYTVSVSATNYQGSTSSATVHTGQITTINVQLASSSSGGAGSLSGTVTNVSDGSAISGATLTLGSVTATSDSSGHFAFTNITAGSYTLTAKASGFVTRSYTVSVSGGATTTQAVQLAFAGALAGTVNSTSGTVISGATVQYTGGVLNQTASLTTDSNGNYSASSIAVGSYTLMVSASGYATNTASATVNSGQTTSVNVSLTAASGNGPGSVSGTVTSVTDSHVLSGAQLSLGNAVTTSDTTGHYTFSNVASGTYTLNAVISGYLARSYSVTVAGNAVTQDVQLSVAGGLTGAITDSNGNAVAGATVQIIGGVLSETFTVTANSLGVYKSGWIPVGNYTVAASATGLTSNSTTATINTGQTTTTNITLGAGGSGGGGGGGGGTITCTPPSNGAIVCNPPDGTTLSSPIHFVAAANSPNGMGDIWTYIDSTVVDKEHNVTNVDLPSLSVPTGTHTVRIQAWDKMGNLFKAGVTLTITSGSGGGTTSGLISPTRAVVTFSRTQQFASITAVTWSVDGIAGGNSTVGTISSSGLYTPPQTVGQHTVTATSQADSTQTADATVWVSNSGPVLTHHYDSYRTGQNISETVLTPFNVNSTTFGKLFSYSIDGFAYAQPLYVPNLNIAGGVHNVVFVATEHDSVYAFDADRALSSPLWHTSFLSSGVTIFPRSSNSGIGPEVGVMSTPVIDLASNTLYVVANTLVNSTTDRYQLHALDITTGAEKFGGPVTISGSILGTGDASSGGVIAFDPAQHLQRPALLLANGAIYIGFGSYGDIDPYHGWVFSYSASDLSQLGVFCDSPNGGRGGIWMAGGGLAADSSGGVFFATGNGTFSAPSGGPDYGDSLVRFSSTSLGIADWFSPYNNSILNADDLDLGSGGPMILPDGTGGANLLVMAGKSRTIYLLDRSNLGQFQAGGDTQVVQAVTNASTGEFFGTPAFWNGWLYLGTVNDSIRAFQLNNGILTTTPTSTTATVFSRGPTPVVTANGTTNGILWALEPTGSTSEILHAWDATNLSRELYNSTQAGSRDDPGPGTKFSVPVVANGRVYVAAKKYLSVYGLLPQ